GKGSRLRLTGASKPLIPILGVPLIERVIRSAREAGADDFYVVTGYHGEHVRTFLKGLTDRTGIRITAIVNGDWEKANGLSVLKARPYLRDPFLLLMADHLFEPSIARELMELPCADGEITLGVDRNIANGLIDMEDVTRVKTEGGKINNIGKRLTDFNGFDTGIFLCTPAIFDALERCAEESGDTSLSGAVRVLASEGRAKAADINGHFWVDVDDPAAVRRAENALLTDLGGKRNDGPVSRYLNRPLSQWISRRLVHYPITPNQVSLFTFVLALISSLLFIIGRPITAALLIHISSILDGCDGELARLKHMQSSFGDFLDAVLDRYADVSILLGILVYSLTNTSSYEIVHTAANPPLIASIFLLAISGTLMVSYTSAKCALNFDYKYKGTWIGAGKGRDIRLFQLFIGGILTFFHPISLLIAVALIALQTNIIVLLRVYFSWQKSRQSIPLLTTPIRALIFDFDGTIADTMPFLTRMAITVLTQDYKLSRTLARRKYLATTGLPFAEQIDLLFPGNSKNHQAVHTFESAKLNVLLSQPLMPKALSTLRYLATHHIKTFICSSTSQGLLADYIKARGLGPLLDGYSGHSTQFGKLQQITSVLQSTQLPPHEVLFVGDSLTDAHLARETKVNFVGLTGTFRSRDFHEIGFPSIASLADLVTMLQRSNSVADTLDSTDSGR
ncbi:MAG: HAD hydrolase-like protein, partial [Deltaproteobacteria bacterium]|nr:HAD hydrolase-like protein [Deltaproteobacteria bacterium]